MRRRAVLVLVGAAMAIAGCGNGGAGADQAPGKITWWVRAANESKSKALAEAWNAHHSPKVVVTAFPDDQFVTRIGTARSGGDLPDVLAVDSVYMPTFLQQSLFTDLTSRVKGLKGRSRLFPQLTTISTDSSGHVFALPRDPGVSMLFWNKDLFEAAGLDPDRAPASWAEIRADAKKITSLGGGVKGFYLAGKCAGCNAFEFFPVVWASGGDVLTKQGGAAFDSPQVTAGVQWLHDMWQDGSIPAGAQSDAGDDWLTGFTAGKIGIQPLGSFAIGGLEKSTFHVGVGYLPGEDGGRGSFIGGDVVGIPRGASHADASWRFIAWTLSDAVQKGIVAKSGELVSRTDLVANAYSEAQPAVVASNRALAFARTPSSRSYQQLVADPNGPFATMLQQGVFGNDPAAAVASAQRAADHLGTS